MVVFSVNFDTCQLSFMNNCRFVRAQLFIWQLFHSLGIFFMALYICTHHKLEGTLSGCMQQCVSLISTSFLSVTGLA